jgi:hypothetical protein
MGALPKRRKDLVRVLLKQLRLDLRRRGVGERNVGLDSSSFPHSSMLNKCGKTAPLHCLPLFFFLFDPIVKTAPMHCLLPPYFFVSLHQTGKTAPLHCLPQRSLFLPILSQWMLEMPGTAHGR